MKNRLLAQLPQHKTCLCSIYNPHLYIVDWKDYNKGAVEISGAQRNVINAVHILNENNVKVFFDAFPENALPITKKKRSRQCECVVFPITCDQDEWILFIETKYANSIHAAKNPDSDYPYCMVRQIKETVSYFRMKGIISENKIVHAIYNPQIQISAESETKRSIFREKDKTKRSKKESAQHSKSRNKSFVMTSVSAL